MAMQGFLMVFVLFLCCAAAYDQLVKHALHWFQVYSLHGCFCEQFV